MGRWSQQQRRGGGPSTAALAIVRVGEIDFNTGYVEFTHAVHAVPVSGAENFVIDGGQTDCLTAQFGVRIYISCPGNFDAATPWTMTGQPEWLVEPIAFPANGVVKFP